MHVTPTYCTNAGKKQACMLGHRWLLTIPTYKWLLHSGQSTASVRRGLGTRVELIHVCTALSKLPSRQGVNCPGNQRFEGWSYEEEQTTQGRRRSPRGNTFVGLKTEEKQKTLLWSARRPRCPPCSHTSAAQRGSTRTPHPSFDLVRIPVP